MTESTIALVEHRVRAITAAYREKGYAVIKAPSSAQMPEFLAGYHPDLLASNASEWVVVVVKPRSALAKEPKISELARLLQNLPEWRLDLALVDTGEQLDVPEESRPFAKEDIRRAIAKAEGLLAAGFAEAALMQAWAGAEAIVRMLTMEEAEAMEEGRLPEPPTSPYVLNTAVYLGAICREDYDFLSQTLRLRNAIAHGLTPPDFDNGLVVALIGKTKRLLEMQPLD